MCVLNKVHHDDNHQRHKFIIQSKLFPEVLKKMKRCIYNYEDVVYNMVYVPMRGVYREHTFFTLKCLIRENCSPIAWKRKLEMMFLVFFCVLCLLLL